MSEFKVGDKVELTPFYLDNYPAWRPGVGTIKEVLKTQQLSEAHIAKSWLGPYHAKHGKQETYPLTGLLVEFAGQICLVSDLGIKSKA